MIRIKKSSAVFMLIAAIVFPVMGACGAAKQVENIPSPESVSQSESDEETTAYLDWMRSAANDSNAVYQYGEWGENGECYDNSGFVARALQSAGFPVTERFTTIDEGERLASLGFVEMDYTGEEMLQPGDILVNDGEVISGHTEVYNGNGELIGARGGNGEKISVTPYYDFGATKVYRYTDI